MKSAVIISLENSQYEPNYESMAVLLVSSIRRFNPYIDIFCGVFTDRQPSSKTIKRLESYHVRIVNDPRFDTNPDGINYFLRNYCCYYFSHVYNLLEWYQQLIYVDIDVVALDSISTIAIPPNTIMVEEVPPRIIEMEKKYIGVVEPPLYYNWVGVINDTNKDIYNIDYSRFRHMKESDIEISKRIVNSGLTIIDQNVGAYYPKHELGNDKKLFHYDGFIDSGTFFMLETFDPVLYTRYRTYAEYVLGIKNNNDEEYWIDFYE